MKKHLY